MNARRLSATACLLACVFAAQGCALMKALRLWRGPKTLTVDVGKIVYRGIEGGRPVFDLPLYLTNESQGEARISDVDLEFRVNGRPAASSFYVEPISIGPSGERALVVPVRVDPVGVAKGLLNEEKEVAFVGKMTVNLGSLGERVIKFRSKKAAFSRDRSRLTLESVSFNRSDLALLRLHVTLKRQGKSAREVTAASLSGEAYINDLHIATIDGKRGTDIDGRIELDADIETVAAVAVSMAIARDKQCDVRLAFRYEAETDTMTYRVPYNFERSGVGVGAVRRVIPGD